MYSLNEVNISDEINDIIADATTIVDSIFEILNIFNELSNALNIDNVVNIIEVNIINVVNNDSIKKAYANARFNGLLYVSYIWDMAFNVSKSKNFIFVVIGS